MVIDFTNFKHLLLVFIIRGTVTLPNWTKKRNEPMRLERQHPDHHGPSSWMKNSHNLLLFAPILVY